MSTTPTIVSEDDFLCLVDEYFPVDSPHQLLTRGDDCAELAMPGEIAMSSDLFLEDVHFRTGYFSYSEIGHKALAVNLSDLAAAGAIPLGFNMNLMLPKTTPRVQIKEFLKGMSKLAAEYELPLIGGDLSGGGKLGVCITVWGKKAGKRFLRRGECSPGDHIFLLSENGTHQLGLARAGLTALEKLGRENAIKDFPQASAAHLTPTPLLKLGAKLAQLDPHASLMDLSDGLARDLPRLLGWSQAKTGLGAELELAESSLSPELIEFSRRFGLSPLNEAVLGGEDYILLGTCKNAGVIERLGKDSDCLAKIIGEVNGNSVTLNRQPLTAGGFDHFNPPVLLG